MRSGALESFSCCRDWLGWGREGVRRGKARRLAGAAADLAAALLPHLQDQLADALSDADWIVRFEQDRLVGSPAGLARRVDRDDRCALGAGLESDEAVREAAYAYQPDRQLSVGLSE